MLFLNIETDLSWWNIILNILALIFLMPMMNFFSKMFVKYQNEKSSCMDVILIFACFVLGSFSFFPGSPSIFSCLWVMFHMVLILFITKIAHMVCTSPNCLSQLGPKMMVIIFACFTLMLEICSFWVGMLSMNVRFYINSMIHYLPLMEQVTIQRNYLTLALITMVEMAVLVLQCFILYMVVNFLMIEYLLSTDLTYLSLSSLSL